MSYKFGSLLLSLMVQSVIHIPGGSTINSGLHALSWQHQSVIHVPHPAAICSNIFVARTVSSQPLDSSIHAVSLHSVQHEQGGGECDGT